MSSQNPTPKLTKKQLKATAFRSKKKIKDLIAPNPTPLPDNDNDDEELLNNNQLVKSLKPTLTSTKKRKHPSSSSSSIESTLKNDHHHHHDQNDQNKDSINGPASKRRKRKKNAILNRKKKSKLILFIGNLPFQISIERLKEFFLEHCDEEPIVRLMTPKTSDRSSSTTSAAPTKGCGFIEFQTSSALQKALRLHHTPLSAESDPSKEHQKKARKINIELTAGGGGNSLSRQKKIEHSHARLAKQREKRIVKSIKEATEKKIKSGLEDTDGDVSIKLGSKKKTRAGLDEDGKADWGTKALDRSGKSTTTTRSKDKWRPQSSGANSIRLG